MSGELQGIGAAFRRAGASLDRLALTADARRDRREAEAEAARLAREAEAARALAATIQAETDNFQEILTNAYNNFTAQNVGTRYDQITDRYDEFRTQIDGLMEDEGSFTQEQSREQSRRMSESMFSEWNIDIATRQNDGQLEYAGMNLDQAIDSAVLRGDAGALQRHLENGVAAGTLVREEAQGKLIDGMTAINLEQIENQARTKAQELGYEASIQWLRSLTDEQLQFVGAHDADGNPLTAEVSREDIMDLAEELEQELSGARAAEQRKIREADTRADERADELLSTGQLNMEWLNSSEVVEAMNAPTRAKWLRTIESLQKPDDRIARWRNADVISDANATLLYGADNLSAEWLLDQVAEELMLGPTAMKWSNRLDADEKALFDAEMARRKAALDAQKTEAQRQLLRAIMTGEADREQVIEGILQFGENGILDPSTQRTLISLNDAKNENPVLAGIMQHFSDLTDQYETDAPTLGRVQDAFKTWFNNDWSILTQEGQPAYNLDRTKPEDMQRIAENIFFSAAPDAIQDQVRKAYQIQIDAVIPQTGGEFYRDPFEKTRLDDAETLLLSIKNNEYVGWEAMDEEQQGQVRTLWNTQSTLLNSVTGLRPANDAMAFDSNGWPQFLYHETSTGGRRDIWVRWNITETRVDSAVTGLRVIGGRGSIFDARGPFKNEVLEAWDPERGRWVLATVKQKGDGDRDPIFSLSDKGLADYE